jgi:hypothetical protein
MPVPPVRASGVVATAHPPLDVPPPLEEGGTTHTPLELHTYAAWHPSVEPGVHFVRQTPASSSHASPLGHSSVLDGVHPPSPSQWFVAIETPEQVVGHDVASPGYVHEAWLNPSQVPEQAPLPPHAARTPWGPPVIGVQVPSLFGLSHAWHWPTHASLQHTPSTHSCEVHWFALVHAEPLSPVPWHAP